MKTKAVADKAMADLEQIYDEVYMDASKVERMISEEIYQQRAKGKLGAQASAILTEEIPLVDMANELKISMAQTRLVIEEFVQTTDLNQLSQLEREYKGWITQFDQEVNAILKGGRMDEMIVVATDNPAIRAAVYLKKIPWDKHLKK